MLIFSQDPVKFDGILPENTFHISDRSQKWVTKKNDVLQKTLPKPELDHKPSETNTADQLL